MLDLSNFIAIGKHKGFYLDEFIYFICLLWNIIRASATLIPYIIQRTWLNSFIWHLNSFNKTLSFILI